MIGAPAPDFVDDDAFPDTVCSNGVNPRTGKYAISAPTLSQLCAVATEQAPTKAELQEIQAAASRAANHLGVGYGVNPNALDEAGWGIVFAANDGRVAEKKERLARLLARRADESGPLFREFSGTNGIQSGETGRAFLARFGDAEGSVAAEKVPYYLLLAGSPSEISFSVQTELDSRHAVGRLDFENLDALEQYALALVAREDAKRPATERAAFFATANQGDQNTHRSVGQLATPLADSLAGKRKAWTVDRQFREAATKQSLANLLGASAHPSLLLTASHGLALDADDEEQRDWQGALITQEWPGPLSGDREMTRDEYFGADDVPSGAALDGMIALFFACFGGGTPPFDEFLPLEDKTLRVLTNTPFVARLPERLLQAGAASVIGHVERAWSCSFSRTGSGTQIRTFEETMLKLADGWRVGAAVESLNVKCNEIAASLANALRRRQFGMLNDDEIADLVLTRTDAANYVILGDPAARLIVAS